MVQFRKSKKVGPFRFTLSKRGIGASLGAGPLRVGIAPDGKVRRTVRLPGTGIYDVKVIGQAAHPRPRLSGPSRFSGPPPVRYQDPSSGKTWFWDGHQWLLDVAPPPLPGPPKKPKNAFAIAGLLLLGVFFVSAGVFCIEVLMSR